MNLKENMEGQVVEKVRKNGVIIMLREEVIRKQAMELLLNYTNTHTHTRKNLKLLLLAGFVDSP